MIHMKLQLPYLVNIPPFMLKGLENVEISFPKKLYLIIKGKLVSLIIKATNGKLFCFLLNLLFKHDGRINFDGKYYLKNISNNEKIYYPNKRIQRVLVNYELHLERLISSYNLDSLDFTDDDVLVDCGSNVGELNLALKNKNIHLKYIAFEPDNQAYECCILNNKSDKDNIHNVALSINSDEKPFYKDSYGGNSSLVDFGTSIETKIKTMKLDDFKIKQIKLLKIDAEGYEPEVLSGSIDTLRETEYVAVDFGPERGLDQKDTIIEVNNFLTDKGFKLLNFEINRITGLYKNVN